MTTTERLARAVLDGRGDLAAALADAVLETNTGFAFGIAERARAAERERIIGRLLNEADHAITHFGELGEAQAAALEHVAQGLMYPEAAE